MAWFQTGLCRASIGFRGIGSKGTIVWRFIGCLGLELPVILWVFMVLAGGGGGVGMGDGDDAVGCGGVLEAENGIGIIVVVVLGRRQ